VRRSVVWIVQGVVVVLVGWALKTFVFGNPAGESLAYAVIMAIGIVPLANWAAARKASRDRARSEIDRSHE
jgi:hypothetical protein